MNNKDFMQYLSNYRENILELLDNHNFSVCDFCLHIDIDKSAIYELSEHFPSTANAIKISKYFNISVDSLIGKLNEFVVAPDYNVTKFYSNLKKILKESKLSERQFCADLAYSRNSFTRWKKGAIPHLATIIEIADYLKCNIDELLS